MRIAIGMLAQEINTFSPLPTTLANFEAQGLYYGTEILKRFEGVGEVGGFIQAARAAPDVEVIPTMATWTMPLGRTTAETHRFLRDRLLEGLRAAGHLDGVLLALHGAMSAEDEHDVEGALLETIRKEWGAGLPIAISLDHHANITEKMLAHVDALVGYHAQPHVDALETAETAAHILFATIRGEIKPVIRWRKIPMIAAGNLLVAEGPLGEFFAQAEAYGEREDVISVSIFPEMPWADVPTLGWTVVAITDDVPEVAQEIADGIARGLWEKRELFQAAGRPTPAQAVDEAIETKGGPVIMGDFGDNTGGGACGDSTAILKELLGKDLGGKAIVSVVDPEAVTKAIAAGVGETVTLDVGGTLVTTFFTPVRVTGRVKTLSDGRYTWPALSAGRADASMGRAAVLEVGDIDILLSEIAGPNFDPHIYRSVGLAPEEAKVVVVKMAYNFRPYYGPFAKKMIVVDSPGVTSQDLKSFPFELAPRPLYPLDEDTQFEI